MARQIVVDIVGDATKFHKATDAAITKSGHLTGKLQGIGKGMVIGAGVGAFNLLTTGIGMALGKLDEAKQAYVEDRDSQDMLAAANGRLAAAQRGNISAIEAKITANQALGVSDSAQRDGIAAFMRQTNDATAAMALNQAAVELAAATGKSYAEAQAEITSGVAGKTKALMKDGVEVAKGASATEVANAVLNKYAGSANKFATTDAGKMAVSNEKIGEAMEKVGMVVSKVSEVALPILADAFSAVVDVLGQVWGAIQPVVDAVAKQLEPVFKAVGPVAQHIFGAIAAAVKALQPVFKVVFDVIGAYIGVWVKVFQTAFGILGKAVGVLQSAFRVMGDAIGAVFKAVSGAVKGAINAVIGVINGLIGAINGIQVHIHINPPIGPSIGFDWNGMNIGKLPYLHAGGVVPGVPGSNVPAILQAGERVIPAGGGAQTIVHIHIEEGAFIDGPSVDRLAQTIAQRLRLSGA